MGEARGTVIAKFRRIFWFDPRWWATLHCYSTVIILLSFSPSPLPQRDGLLLACGAFVFCVSCQLVSEEGAAHVVCSNLRW